MRLPDGNALLATVDFITPLCDDAASFGRIAAANAVSDIFAMGGRPTAALSIACYPLKSWSLDTLGEMLRGGVETLASVGVPVIGGHSVEDAEMKLGYAVMGLAEPGSLWRNAGARPGDELWLTKRLGTGVLAAAARDGKSGSWWDAAIAQMCETNERAASAGRAAGAAVHAATDITGFGLAGHAAEMARASGVTLRLLARELPLLDEARALVGRGYVTRGRDPNRAYAEPLVVEAGVPADLVDLALDPQTSGGLLLAVAPGGDFAARLRDAGCLVARIGVAEAASGPAVVIAG